MKLCKYLRWKSYYGRQFQDTEELEAMFAWNEVPYECLRTARNWGPDDDLVAPECCTDQRSCFELSDLSPRLKIS